MALFGGGERDISRAGAVYVGWLRLGVFHAILNGALIGHSCQQGNPTSEQEICFLMLFKLLAGLSRNLLDSRAR